MEFDILVENLDHLTAAMKNRMAAINRECKNIRTVHEYATKKAIECERLIDHIQFNLEKLLKESREEL